MPFPVAAAIAGGASLLGGWFAGDSQKKANREQMAFAEKMYQRQLNDNRDDWARQNEYNDPSAQMQRLRAAGLNENLIYGNGTAVTTADQSRGASAPNYNPSPVNYMAGIPNAIASYQDYAMKEAQTNNLKAQNTVLQNDAFLKSLEAAGKILDNSQKKDLAPFVKQKLMADIFMTESSWRMSEKKYTDEFERFPAELERIKAVTASINRDTRLKDLDIQLKERGINPSDPVYMRVFGRILSGEISVTDVLKNVRKFLN